MLPISLARNAYGYPLLRKHLLTRSRPVSATQVIVSGTDMRLNYAQLTQRIGQLAKTLKANGFSEGMRVGVMEEIQSRVGLGVFSKWAVPDDIMFIDQLSKTNAGKLNPQVISARSDIRS